VIVVLADELVILPDHPEKVEQAFGEALRFTTVPQGYEVPEAGVKVPLPLPEVVMVSV
jgi:hypothetical protein